MNEDFLNALLDDDSFDIDAAKLYETNPSAWLLKEVEDDSDHCFTLAGTDRYRAVVQKKSALVQIEVALDEEGFLCVRANTGIMVDEHTEIPFRMFQMLENATFKQMGYVPAKAGEVVTFETRLRPSAEADLNEIVGLSVSSCANQMPAFEKIRAGVDVKDVHREMRSKHLLTAMRLHSLFS